MRPFVTSTFVAIGVFVPRALQRQFYETNGYVLIKKLVPQARIDVYAQRFLDIANGRVEKQVHRMIGCIFSFSLLVRLLLGFNRSECSKTAFPFVFVCVCVVRHSTPPLRVMSARAHRPRHSSIAPPPSTSDQATMLMMRDVTVAKQKGMGEKSITKLQDFMDDEVLFQYCAEPEVLRVVESIVGADVKAMHTMLINKVCGGGNVVVCVFLERRSLARLSRVVSFTCCAAAGHGQGLVAAPAAPGPVVLSL